MKLHLAQVGPLPATNSTASREPLAPPPRPQPEPTATTPSHFHLKASAGPPPGSNDFRRRMAAVGEALRSQGVGAILLVSSSFAADDARQLLLAVARHWPDGKTLFRQLASQIVDDRSHDAGNFTPAFAQFFQQTLSRRNHEIPVRLVHWSGENHHLGRADAAVRLIDELAALELPPGKRAMLWGHGQAGNVLSLLSVLLSSEAAALERFFAAAQIYYRLPAIGVIDVPLWHHVQKLLRNDRDRLTRRPLDLVTFGTPPRNGWSLRVTDSLLHFVHHRPAEMAAPLAPLPQRLAELLNAAAGDYVQQLAVPGTETPPSRFAWRSWLADRRLRDLLDAEASHATVAERLTCGTRVADAGRTLLVDYGPPTGPVSEHLAGHAVYTRRDWLLFHAEQAVQRLTGHASSSAQAA